MRRLWRIKVLASTKQYKLRKLSKLRNGGAMSAKNAQAKTVKRENAYEIWETPDSTWTWYVLKKYQADDSQPYARWLCEVVSPFTPQGETGDTYVKDVRENAIRIK